LIFCIKRFIWWTRTSLIDDLLIGWALTIFCLIVVYFSICTGNTISFSKIKILVCLTSYALTSIVEWTLFWALTKLRSLIECLLDSTKVLCFVFMRWEVSYLQWLYSIKCKQHCDKCNMPDCYRFHWNLLSESLLIRVKYFLF